MSSPVAPKEPSTTLPLPVLRTVPLVITIVPLAAALPGDRQPVVDADETARDLNPTRGRALPDPQLRRPLWNNRATRGRINAPPFTWLAAVPPM